MVGIFGIILLVLFAIVCALLVFMVIIQDQDSEGLGGIFGGASSAAFGSRSTNIVVRFTYVLGALFFVLAIGLAVVNKSEIGDVEAAALNQNQSSEWFDSAAGTEGVTPTISEPTDTTILEAPEGGSETGTNN